MIFDEKTTQRSKEQALTQVAVDPKPSSFGENVAAAWDSYKFTDAGGAYERHVVDAYDARNKTIKELTGQEIDNPYASQIDPRLGVGSFGTPEQTAEIIRGGGGNVQEVQTRAIEDYENRVASLLDTLTPEQRALIKTPDQITEEISAEAKRLEERRNQMAASGGMGGLAGQLVGGMGAAMTTPEQIMTLPLGAPGKMGIVARILTEAAIGAGVEASLQPGVQEQRAKMGLESGLGPALENIAMAGAGGAVFAGGMGVARAIVRGGSAAFKAKFGRTPTLDEKAALDVAAQALEVEAATPYTAKNAATVAVFEANQKAAASAAIAGRAVQPQELRGQELERREPINNPAGPYQVLAGNDLLAIETDAKLMQFKAGGDDEGVTDRLRGVTKWDPERSGMLLVYEFEDGRRIIADGHQRLGLAKRLASEGQDVQAAAIVLRQADGITPAQARARAAYKNMAEGSGTATDAAKILRDSGASLADLNLPPKSAMLRDAEGLSAVNDDVFGMVVNDVIPDRFAAAIGRMVKDELLQTNIAGLLVKLRPSTLFEAEQIIDQARRSGVVNGTQESLFGDTDVAESLYLERARVLERAQRLLRQDATTFRTLLARGADIADEGNILDQGANAARLEADQKVMQFVRSLSNRKGPIGNALTDAATLAKSDGNYARAARAFLEAVTGRIDDPEIVGATGRGDFGDDEFTPANGSSAEGEPGPTELIPDENTLELFANPSSPQVAEQVDRLQNEIRQAISDSDEGFALPEIGAPVSTLRRPLGQISRILAEFKARQPERSIEESYLVLPERQAELEAVGKKLGRRKGVTFKTPGLKAIEGAREKMGRKGYTSTRELTDLVRAGFEVETPAQANALVSTLAKQFRVLDEGWLANGALYFDRKVLIQFDDGTIGEIQIWNPALLKAKGKGHKLYTQSRKFPAGSPEQLALINQQRQIYGEAIDQLDDDWLSEVWVSEAANGGNGGTLGNILPKLRAETGVPDSRTSTTSAGSQSDLPEGTNIADASSMTTAGRPSQLKNELAIADPLQVDTTDIGLPPGALQVEPGAEGLPQMLMPGVAPVRDLDRMQLEAGRGLDASRDPDADFGLFGDNSSVADMFDMLRNEGPDLRGMEIPIGERLDADGNRVAEVQTLGDMLDDLDADAEFMNQLDICDRSAR